MQMIQARYIWPLLLGVCCLALAQSNDDKGLVVRNAELRESASFKAEVVTTLTAGTQVILGAEQRGWRQITLIDGSSKGWLRKYQVRAGNWSASLVTTNNDQNRGLLGNLTNLSRTTASFFGSRRSTATSETTATLGIRGLSAAELENAQANPEQFERLKTFQATKQAALDFAKAGALQTQQVAYMEEN